MRHPYGETIQRIRAIPVVDPYSGEESALDWSSVTELNIDGVAVDDSKTTALIEVGREPVVTDFVLYPPAHSDITHADRVRVRGLVCRVEGRPSQPRNPFTGDEPGMVVHANIVEG